MTNDPNLVSDYLLKLSVRYNGETTVLSEGWVFNKTGNTRLKRKRKNTNSVSQTNKHLDWLNFTCQVWDKKFNREKKARFMDSLQTTDKELIEDQIKNYSLKK
jgi:hypothetical protein